jgi:hypothetical protein
MVPELRAQARLSDDVDEHWPLQRTCGRLLAVDSVLNTIDQGSNGSGGPISLPPTFVRLSLAA